MALEKAAKQLIEKVSTSNSALELSGVLTEHESCFSGEECDVCTYMDEELNEWLLVCMAGNPNITEELENSIHSAALSWQGRDTAVLMALSKNQSLSESMKEFILDADLWYGMGDGEELVERLLEIMEENPIYSLEEIEKFKAYCESEYGYGISN